MKQFLTTVFCLFILSISAQEKNFKEFYKAHKKEANLSLNVPGFIASFFIDDQDDKALDDLLDKANNYKVLVFDNNSSSVQKDFKKFVKRNKLKTIVRIKDKGDRISIHFREEKNRIKEIIVNVFSKNKDAVMVGLKTNLTKEELNTIISKTDIKLASK
ncbi:MULTISPECIES: DUF4252 domain-containing protein [Tenacibaculum]|uniref:DUF4252 domain-containing protein n=1 Tax=Tenacibaculum TaxID=104267 RepID=UPI001F0A3349|nr:MULTISPECIES: DUF4252 domain-containing protein [Tenacibaculum]MCH3881226.1 DUF4252 domain-containing protein [Tenacibaculum aquimarinum]MDO6599180.1 DUF4252 domain-containing protein [Tenacibaculum sp. 1_MG-2023]